MGGGGWLPRCGAGARSACIGRKAAPGPRKRAYGPSVPRTNRASRLRPTPAPTTRLSAALTPRPPHRTLAEIEKMAILQTLQRTNWNKQEAAQILGLYRPTLYSKMKKHEIRDAGKSARSAAAPPPPQTPAAT